MAITRFFLKRKKKPDIKKRLKSFIGPEISAESAMIATGKVLIESMDIARNKKDVDGLLSVADRWYNISRLILEYNAQLQEEENEEEKEKIPMGFIGEKNVTKQADTRETDNESESSS